MCIHFKILLGCEDGLDCGIVLDHLDLGWTCGWTSITRGNQGKWSHKMMVVRHQVCGGRMVLRIK